MKNAFNINNWKVYYINLDHRKDRREHIESELKKIHIQAERFSGKTDNDVIYFPEIEFANCTTPPAHSPDFTHASPHSPGNWGCTLSHYSVLKKHLESKDERILAIFEDDAYFSDDFNERLQYLQENCDIEWDMFYLGSWCRLINDEKTQVKYVWRIRDVVLGGHGYLINPKSLPKLIELVKAKAKETEIIDSIYFHLVPHLKMYAFIPGMVGQIKSKSDIGRSTGDYDSLFSYNYGEHIFAKNLKDFREYKTSKLYLYLFVISRGGFIGLCGQFLRTFFPRIHKILKPYFSGKN